MKTLYTCDNCKFEYDVTIDSFIYTRCTGQNPEIIDRVKFLEFYTGIVGEDKFGKNILGAIPGIFQKVEKVVKLNQDDDTLPLFEETDLIISCEICEETPEYMLVIKNMNLRYYICADCIDSVEICTDCGNLYKQEDMQETEGEYICQGCFDENYSVCEDCGKVTCNDDMNTVHSGRYRAEKYVCASCIDDYYRCIECNDYHDGDFTITLHNGDHICQSCYENGSYFTCDNCGESFHYDDIANSDDGCYCQSCYDDRGSSIIHPHWSKLSPIFHGTGPLFFGIEQEIDDGNNPRETAESIIETIGEDSLYIETDGSLNDNGLELVYFPRSWDSWKEFYYKLDNVRKIALSNSYLSHETSTCGLHVHVSRNALESADCPSVRENIGKIMLLYEMYFSEFVKFSRRKSSGLTRWAKNNPIGYRESADPMEYYEAAEESGDRYRAVNIEPKNTIEFRFFRGTLLPDTILASIGLCYNLAMLSTSKTQEEIEKLEFADIINYDNGTNYVKDYWNSRIARQSN